MSRVVFLDPIDHVSGKLSKKSRVTYCYAMPDCPRKAKTDATHKSAANVPLRTPLQSWHASTSSALLLRLWLLS